MKEIKAYLSSNILQYVLPLNAIDSSRDALTKIESETLYKLWKKAGKDEKIVILAAQDHFILSSLKQKGYITYTGSTAELTKRGKEAIKIMVLSNEENAFKKKD